MLSNKYIGNIFALFICFLGASINSYAQYDFGVDLHFQRDQNLKYKIAKLQEDSIQVYDYILAIEAKKSFYRNLRSNYRSRFAAIEFLYEEKPFEYCNDTGNVVVDIFITTDFGGSIVRPSKVLLVKEHTTLESECSINSAINAVREFNFYIPGSTPSRADIYNKTDLFIGSFRIQYPIEERGYFNQEISRFLNELLRFK